MEKVSVDFEKKTADVLMKPGSSLEKQAVAAALKKNGGYGIAGFIEKILEPEKPKSGIVIVGVSGMT